MLNISSGFSIFSYLHKNWLSDRKVLLLVFFVFWGILTPKYFLAVPPCCLPRSKVSTHMQGSVSKWRQSGEYFESRSLHCKQVCKHENAISICWAQMTGFAGPNLCIISSSRRPYLVFTHQYYMTYLIKISTSSLSSKLWCAKWNKLEFSLQIAL